MPAGNLKKDGGNDALSASLDALIDAVHKEYAECQALGICSACGVRHDPADSRTCRSYLLPQQRLIVTMEELITRIDALMERLEGKG